MLLKNNRHICSRMGREFKKHCKTWKLNSVCDYLYHNYITHDNSTTTQSYKSSGLTRYLWLTSRYTSLTRRWLDFIVNQAGIRHSLVDDWTSLSTNFYIVIQLLPISSLSLSTYHTTDDLLPLLPSSVLSIYASVLLLTHLLYHDERASHSELPGDSNNSTQSY